MENFLLANNNNNSTLIKIFLFGMIKSMLVKFLTFSSILFYYFFCLLFIKFNYDLQVLFLLFSSFWKIIRHLSSQMNKNLKKLFLFFILSYYAPLKLQRNYIFLFVIIEYKRY